MLADCPAESYVSPPPDDANTSSTLSQDLSVCFSLIVWLLKYTHFKFASFLLFLLKLFLCWQLACGTLFFVVPVVQKLCRILLLQLDKPNKLRDPRLLNNHMSHSKALSLCPLLPLFPLSFPPSLPISLSSLPLSPPVFPQSYFPCGSKTDFKLQFFKMQGNSRHGRHCCLHNSGHVFNTVERGEDS